MTVCFQIRQSTYNQLAQNGARILFETSRFRILDGIDRGNQSYFIIDFYYSDPRFYQIDIDECYSLIAMKMVNVDPKIIEEEIFEMIKGSKPKL
jgi:hypothetical protein